MTGYFSWNWDPVVFEIFGFGIRWYSLMFLCGFVLGNVNFVRMVREEGRDVDATKDSLLYHVVFGTIIGARLGHCLFYDPIHYLTHPLDILKTYEGGLASHGGFLGVMIGLWLFSRKNKSMPFFWLADRIAIVAILGGAFIRLGNFFNSEVLGRPTDVPWAVIFERVDHLPRHPTPLYEALGYATLSLILYAVYRFYKRQPLEGRIFGLVLVLGYGFRFFIEQFKENQVAFEDGMLLNMGQILSLPFMAIGICFVLGLHHNWSWMAWGFNRDSGTAKPERRKKLKKA